jgi:hypothetical protein
MELFFKLVWIKLLRTTVLRRISIYVWKRKKGIVVVKNNSDKKIFLLRKEHDFAKKKAVKIQPSQQFNVVIKKPYNEKVCVHDGEKIIYVIYEPLFELVIDNDDKIDDLLVFTPYR